MQNNTVETIIGAIVVAVAAIFLFYAYTSTGSGRVSGYDLYARFAAADGITNGTDVRLHGIKVGTVTSSAFSPILGVPSPSQPWRADHRREVRAELGRSGSCSLWVFTRAGRR